MSVSRVVCSFVLAAARCAAAEPTSNAKHRPPNIVLINCDNLGYGDVDCFGSTKHRTPHIDLMAAEGMRLTSFYSAISKFKPKERHPFREES